MDRISQLRRGLTKDMAILEIGPYFNPIAPKAEGWRTTVVDRADKAQLLAWASNGDDDIKRLSVNIEDVDIIWNGGPLDELCLPKNPAGFDVVIASHVLEHIPDLIRFFKSLSRIIKPKGRLSFAVPDLRYCFDFYKPPTSTAKVLAAYRNQCVHHFPETVFEAKSCSAHIDHRGAWLREPFVIPQVAGDLLTAYEDYLAYVRAEENRTSSYVDAHCWHFTPGIFKVVMFELNCLSLIEFDVEWVEENPGSEFIVQMVRKPNVVDAEGIRETRNHLYRKAMGELTNRAPY
jgi:SAM-dependent methyltransferase